MKKRVLVLNCGTLASTYINMLLKNNNEFELWGASTYSNHGEYVYKNYIDDIPNITCDSFLEVLNKKIEMYNFKFIIAPHEDLALYLQKNSDKINAKIVCSCYETTLLCRYKSRLYKKMIDYDFDPIVYKNDVKEFPVFAKKDDDQGARNAFKVDCYDELVFYNKKYPNMVVTEYLPGEEITVDCFTNKNGKLLFISPRLASRILAGIDVHSVSIKTTDEIEFIAKSLNAEISFRGYWFFQIKKDKYGKYKLLEISTRLAGAFALTRAYDINLPLMALKDFDGQDVEKYFKNTNKFGVETDMQFFARYKLDINYENVIIDFESCFKDGVDELFMAFIYQCLNNNKKLMLLTNNEKFAKQKLKRLKIDSSIFEYISENKKDENCILISNNENQKSDINSFSICNIDSLIDWRK